MHKVLQPGIVGVADRRQAVFPARIIAQLLTAPIADVKGLVGQDEIGFQIGVTII